MDPDQELLYSGVEFNLILKNAINSPSLRPTSSFTAMIFTDSDGLELAGFTDRISLTNEALGLIDNSTATITQTSYQPDEESIITLAFDTNNPLPVSSAIEILVPFKIPRIVNEAENCFVLLNDVRFDDKCAFTGKLISITNLFSSYETKFVGRIELNFKILNPGDNEDLKVEPYKINIYDDETMLYGIDKLDDFLFPILGCEYPCNTCLSNDPYHCTSCLVGKPTTPHFLYWGRDQEKQTCLDFCPDGYTSDGTDAPRQCKPCADTCATCAQNDLPGDVNVCVTCRDEFPYFWQNRSSCHSTRCPEGTYESNTLDCLSCEAPCKFCSGPGTCTQCFAENRLKYLFEGECLLECVEGYTPIDNKCVRCQSPCNTCKFGQVDACTSCDNANGN